MSLNKKIAVSFYFLRRLLLALPTLLVVSLVAFALRTNAPGDRVEEQFGPESTPSPDPLVQSARYGSKAQTMGLDKPVFFWSQNARTFPDTLYRVFPPRRRKWLVNMASQTGNWQTTNAYEAAVFESVRMLEKQPDSIGAKTILRPLINQLYNGAPETFDSVLAQAKRDATDLPAMLPFLEKTQQKLVDWHNTPTRANLWLPAFRWYGFDNQYVHWLGGMVGLGEAGLSKQTKRPMWSELRPALYVSLTLNGIALFFSFLLALPLGVWMARNAGKWPERWTKRVLMFSHALPLFWIGAMLMMLFATPGMGLHLIKGIAINPWPGGGLSFVQWLGVHAVKFILPVAAIVFHYLAMLSLQMRGSMLDVLAQDYLRTSKAMGLKAKTVYWKHAFRNALFPVITMFGRLLPGVFGGAITIEYLFQIPGMGIKTQQAFYNQDFPMLMALIFLMACITIVGALLADWLYTLVDPRVKLG